MLVGLIAAQRALPHVRAVDFVLIFAAGVVFGVSLMGLIQAWKAGSSCTGGAGCRRGTVAACAVFLAACLSSEPRDILFQAQQPGAPRTSRAPAAGRRHPPPGRPDSFSSARLRPGRPTAGRSPSPASSATPLSSTCSTACRAAEADCRRLDGLHRFPPCSPDGTRLLFSAGTHEHYSIYLIRTHGSASADLPDTLTYRSPSWSPNGREFAVSSYQNGRSEIQVVTLSTGARARCRRRILRTQISRSGRPGRRAPGHRLPGRPAPVLDYPARVRFEPRAGRAPPGRVTAITDRQGLNNSRPLVARRPIHRIPKQSLRADAIRLGPAAGEPGGLHRPAGWQRNAAVAHGQHLVRRASLLVRDALPGHSDSKGSP